MSDKMKVMKAGELKPKDVVDMPNWIYERKYDGSRHLVLNGDIVSERMIVRNDRYKHLYDELQKIPNLKDVALDGEIYIDGGTVLDLNASVNWHKAKMCVFDVIVKGKKLAGRREEIKRLVSHCNPAVIHLPVCYDKYDVAWKDVESKSWEGLMMKDLNGYYEFKRSNSWLKVKRKECVDVEIIGHEAGSDKGTFLIKMPSGVEGRVSGTKVEYVDYYHKVKPKKMEISYMYLTKDGKPFQPVINKFIE